MADDPYAQWLQNSSGCHFHFGFDDNVKSLSHFLELLKAKLVVH